MNIVTLKVKPIRLLIGSHIHDFEISTGNDAVFLYTEKGKFLFSLNGEDMHTVGICRQLLPQTVIQVENAVTIVDGHKLIGCEIDTNCGVIAIWGESPNREIDEIQCCYFK